MWKKGTDTSPNFTKWERAPVSYGTGVSRKLQRHSNMPFFIRLKLKGVKRVAKSKTDNLIKNSDLTPQERKEKASKAGKKSGEVRAQRRLLKDELISLLQLEITDSETNKKVPTQIAISTALIKEALSGDVKAFVAIRDTIGEKPATVVSVGDDNKQLLKEYLEGLKK